MLILDPWGISFHAVVVFALGKNFLFNFLHISKCVCQLTVQYVDALDKGQKQTNKDRSDRPSINCKGKLYQEARHSVLQ